MPLIKRNVCPACSKGNFKVIYSLIYSDEKLSSFLKSYYGNRVKLDKIKDSKYSLLECVNCSLIFQEEIPSNNFLNILYEDLIDTRISFKKKNNFEIKYNKKLNYEIKLINSIFRKDPKSIDILEFGAGWGYWSKYMQNKNYNISAFEISEKRINFMRKNNIKVIDELDNFKDKFDLIYSEETFEHISKPKETLVAMSKLLKNNGFILLRFPSNFLFKLKLNNDYKPKADCAHPLEHINLFNKKSFEFMVKDTDLEIITFKSKINLSLIQILKDLKNFFYFDSILLKKNHNLSRKKVNL